MHTQGSHPPFISYIGSFSSFVYYIDKFRFWNVPPVAISMHHNFDEIAVLKYWEISTSFYHYFTPLIISRDRTIM